MFHFKYDDYDNDNDIDINNDDGDDNDSEDVVINSNLFKPDHRQSL